MNPLEERQPTVPEYGAFIIAIAMAWILANLLIGDRYGYLAAALAAGAVSAYAFYIARISKSFVLAFLIAGMVPI